MLEKLKNPKVCLLTIAAVTTVIVVVLTAVLIHTNIEAERRLDAESVILKEDLTVNYGETYKVSDFLEELKGTLVEDSEITPDALGALEVTFEYINIKNKKRTVHFDVNVVDANSPKIYGSSIYTLNVGYQGDLTELILSGDDLDDHPTREIIGTYDLNKTGSYNLEYVITDAYGNQARHPFTLNVVKPSSNTTQPQPTPKLDISEVIKKHKTSETKIGIDVSQWQGEIDWERVKSDGVEFVFIRVGYQTKFDGEYILDPYFKDNLVGATSVGLPVGIYFYSYAHSIDQAKDQAEWIISQLDGYPIELGIAFDWESWAEFNNSGMSFRTINNVAKAFLDTAKSSGYEGLLYSSKNYLDRIWNLPGYNTWLAQYYDHVTYDGDYQIWQMSSSGKVDGIYGDVDLNIMYSR